MYGIWMNFELKFANVPNIFVKYEKLQVNKQLEYLSYET